MFCVPVCFCLITSRLFTVDSIVDIGGHSSPWNNHWKQPLRDVAHSSQYKLQFSFFSAFSARLLDRYRIWTFPFLLAVPFPHLTPVAFHFHSFSQSRSHTRLPLLFTMVRRSICVMNRVTEWHFSYSRLLMGGRWLQRGRVSTAGSRHAAVGGRHRHRWRHRQRVTWDESLVVERWRMRHNGMDSKIIGLLIGISKLCATTATCSLWPVCHRRLEKREQMIARSESERRVRRSMWTLSWWWTRPQQHDRRACVWRAQYSCWSAAVHVLARTDRASHQVYTVQSSEATRQRVICFSSPRSDLRRLLETTVPDVSADLECAPLDWMA